MEYLSDKDLWYKVLENMQAEVKQVEFATWFQHSCILSRQEGLLVVGLPNMFSREWLEKKLRSSILTHVRHLAPDVHEIEFEMDMTLGTESDTRGFDVVKMFAQKKPRKIPNRQEVRLLEGISSKCLNPKYTMDNFVVGPDNRLAHAAAYAVTKSPGSMYNPLFIYGGVGLGKTHLLQAIGNELLFQDPQRVVVYMTSERFTNEIIEAIGKRNSKSFKDKYRKVDCLIIDDVQFLANKDRTQEEFFHTFNDLYDNNKQIIISSDKPPKDLEGLEARLVSRFEMGMIVDVQVPDYETRLAILNAKCRHLDYHVPLEVLDFIANNVHDSVRELEGVLTQAVAQAQLEQSMPSVKSVMGILKKLNRSFHGPQENIETRRGGAGINADWIVDEIAKYYHITVEDLMGSSRKRPVMLPRQLAMYMIRHELHEPYELIGDRFGGKNHTTVMHACEKIAEAMQEDRKFLKEVQAIKKNLNLHWT